MLTLTLLLESELEGTLGRNALLSPAPWLLRSDRALCCAAGLLTGGTGVFLPAQQASRRRSLPVGGIPSAMPGGFVPGAQQLSYLQVAALFLTCCTRSTYQATVL